MMPGGLINSMNEEEVKDLIAYFVSGGDRKHKVYRSGKLEIELISSLYGEDGNPKKQMDVGKSSKSNWTHGSTISRLRINRGESAGGISKFCILPTNTRGRPSPRKSKRTESSRSTNNLSVESPLLVQFFKFDGILDRTLKFLVEGSRFPGLIFPLFW